MAALCSPYWSEEQQPHTARTSPTSSNQEQQLCMQPPPTSQRSHHCCKQHRPEEPLSNEEQCLPRLPEKQPQPEEPLPPKEQPLHDLTSRSIGKKPSPQHKSAGETATGYIEVAANYPEGLPKIMKVEKQQFLCRQNCIILEQDVIWDFLS
ncbi:hypothetical protein QTO34_014305 [Cnephaeus nilssonii]|uniref:Uncharacterized protein n=1 Tax=Cnephaeus nilssonii TaxID=3371016 RepID=A0AA40I764_CNENI|nr:hypothetical protein QTO34_014305 [Eptesicus nilssonii]